MRASEAGPDVAFALQAAGKHESDPQTIPPDEHRSYHRKEYRQTAGQAPDAFLCDEFAAPLARLQIVVSKFEERSHFIGGTFEDGRIETIQHPSPHLDAAFTDIDDLPAVGKLILRQMPNGLERIVERERRLVGMFTVAISRLRNRDHDLPPMDLYKSICNGTAHHAPPNERSNNMAHFIKYVKSD